jgi:fructose transport system permease protein
VNRPEDERRRPLARLVAAASAGPLLALVAAVLAFSLTTDTFFTADNLSLLLEQSVVVGVLALGQTLVVLAGGIDLANGAIAVLGTIVMARHGETLGAAAGLLLGLLLCCGLGAASGGLVARLRLPPFIVTLGMLTVVSATARLYSQSRNYPVRAPLLTVFGEGIHLGSFSVSGGAILMLAAYGLVGYALRQTAWGRHVYATGGNAEAARRMGIRLGRTVTGVYAGAGLLYGVAAWAALGRIPNADANAYQNANLDSITAVVIGGTSLFGGRGGVLGSLLGTLIVSVLRSGLTQAGIDALYQDVATGVLVIVAVAVDQASRRQNGRARGRR